MGPGWDQRVGQPSAQRLFGGVADGIDCDVGVHAAIGRAFADGRGDGGDSGDDASASSHSARSPVTSATGTPSAPAARAWIRSSDAGDPSRRISWTLRMDSVCDSGLAELPAALW